MDSTKINEWLHVVGLFGVIASLLFVGLQMKQDRDVATLAAYQARTDLTANIIIEMMDNPEYRAARLKLNQPNVHLSQLTPAETQLVMMEASARLYMTENVHFQYESGFLPEDHWQKSREVLKNGLRMEHLRYGFENRPEQWRQSFGDLIREITAEIDAEAAQ